MSISDINNNINTPSSYLHRCIFNGKINTDKSISPGLNEITVTNLKNNGAWSGYKKLDSIFINIKNSVESSFDLLVQHLHSYQPGKLNGPK